MPVKQVAQGDVLFTRIGDVPAKTRIRPKKNPLKILEGESSGHIHNVHGRANFYRATELGIDLGTIDVAKGGATIKHQKNGKPTGDHGDVPLPAGRWKVTRQREFREGSEEMVED